MQKKSFGETSPSSYKIIGIKVLPTKFEMPSLRTTRNNIDSSDYDVSPSISQGKCLKEEVEINLNNQMVDDLEELTESERDLKIDYERCRAEWLKEQGMRVQEKQRLDEILKICTEYEQELDREKQAGQGFQTEMNNSSPRLCPITKIKTNGSLTSPVHIRRFAEMSKDRHTATQLFNFDVCYHTPQDITSKSFNTNAQNVDSFLPGSWSTDDQLSFHSSSEFLDKSSTLNRLKSFYENDDVFPSTLTDSSDCLNSDDALDDPFESSIQIQNVRLEEEFRVSKASLTANYAHNDTTEKGNDIESKSTTAAELSSRSFETSTALRKMKTESVDKIENAKKRIQEIDGSEEKAIKELEHEMEMLMTESNEELSALQSEVERMAVIKEQQMERLLQAAREREDFQKQVLVERNKLVDLENRFKDSKNCSEKNTKQEMQQRLLLKTMKLHETLEAQQRLFDDLEFNLLELETRQEEEREPVQKKLILELNSLLQSKSQREETLRLIEQQKLDILHQVKADLTDFEKERLFLIDVFKKERLVFSAINDQMSSLSSNNSSENILNMNDGSTSSVQKDLCKTPPIKTKTRHKFFDLEKQIKSSSQFVKDSEDDSSYSREKSTLSEDSNSYRKVFSSGSEESSFNSLDEDINRNVPVHGKKSECNSGNSFVTANNNLLIICQSEGGNSVIEEEARQMEFRGDKHHGRDRENLSKTTDQGIHFRESQKTQARPLTRYLPVRDKSLDLRHFVESSGHTVDDNSPLLISSSACRGYLKKLAGKFRTWHKRWFVFDRNKRCLMYYVDHKETKLRRNIYFQTIVDVFVDHLQTVSSPNQKLTFCLKTIDRRFYLVAPTPEVMRIWIDVLFTGAEGYQEFW